jgi:molybdopterin molybdotransferase
MTTNLACAGTEPVSFDAARSILIHAVEPQKSEWISLSDAAGRVAAEDVVAKEDLVPYARSAMDGFALRSIDTLAASPESPLGLPLVGKAFTGDRQSTLATGAVLGINTGAAIPLNADAVVPLEQVTSRRADLS